METKMRDRFQQRLSPQLFSSGKNINIFFELSAGLYPSLWLAGLTDIK